MIGECQGNFTILMTDGAPTSGDLMEVQTSNQPGQARIEQVEVDGPGNLCPASVVDHDWCALSGYAADCSDVPGGFQPTTQNARFSVDDLAACYQDYGDTVEDVLYPASGDEPLGTYTIGFTVSGTAGDVLDDAAERGGGEFYLASDADELAEAFAAATASILNQTSSGTAAAVVASSTVGADILVTASFQPVFWEGRVQAYALPLPNDGSSPTEVWDAGELLEVRDPATRTIYSVIEDPTETDPCSGTCPDRIDDRVDLTAANVTAFYEDGVTDLFEIGPGQTALAADVVAWTRGTDVPGHRTRDPDDDGHVWKMGDIIEANPIVVGSPPFFYPVESYGTFYETYKDRTPVVYATHNAGGVSALDAATGEELWYFVPNFNLPYLDDLMDPVLLPPLPPRREPPRPRRLRAARRGDASEWRTIMVLGGGTRGAYVAFDITDPSDPDYPKILWQWPNPVDFAVPSVLAYPEFGKARARPAGGMKLQNASEVFPGDPTDGRWKVWLGSGPENVVDGKARVFEIRLHDGKSQDVFDFVPASIPQVDNWSTEVSLLDVDSDHVTDHLYVGMQNGFLYRQEFGPDGSNTDRMQLVFDTTDSVTSDVLPLTARPLLSFFSSTIGDPNVLVHVGTGRFETQGDKADLTVQRVFTLRDDTSLQTGPDPTNRETPLRTYDPAASVGSSGTGDLVNKHGRGRERPSSVDYGWFVDLKVDANGEPRHGPLRREATRSLTDAVLLNGDPVPDRCSPPPTTPATSAGRGLPPGNFDSQTGNAPSPPVMDTDGDGDVDEDDTGVGTYLGSGMPSEPVIDPERGMLIVQTSDTTIHTTAIDTGSTPVVPRRWSTRGGP